jgi:hypothetical protein
MVACYEGGVSISFLIGCSDLYITSASYVDLYGVITMCYSYSDKKNLDIQSKGEYDASTPKMTILYVYLKCNPACGGVRIAHLFSCLCFVGFILSLLCVLYPILSVFLEFTAGFK